MAAKANNRREEWIGSIKNDSEFSQIYHKGSMPLTFEIRNHVHPMQEGLKDFYLRKYMPENERIKLAQLQNRTLINDPLNKFNPRAPPAIQKFKTRLKNQEVVKSASLNLVGHENMRLQKVMSEARLINSEKLNAESLHNHDFRPTDKSKWLSKNRSFLPSVKSEKSFHIDSIHANTPFIGTFKQVGEQFRSNSFLPNEAVWNTVLKDHAGKDHDSVP
mmetsp:Transcript_42619/g.40899  ORF Transcript_42619/g.40899 Transcript_42619/m.40899 type:complete len:218 (+) Transcript_42619:67-720(+)|eukprot:CAMPEP_0170555758 /NCGR_PEP_ID=MMETSP0211-20121228/13587_1 /TAXON_ID=311385 /ORGANISM="Pseudokeronopsis sp., Strain OXSARD2" /LENGTH=217 /DNA_ID=CAMNT_0010865741 /DNA_START=10 /DNA_END=663 /DNA_ORIENTATION=+